MDELLNKFKFVLEMSVDIIKFVVAVQNWSITCEGIIINRFLQ
jgi:hypothetical protein